MDYQFCKILRHDGKMRFQNEVSAYSPNLNSILQFTYLSNVYLCTKKIQKEGDYADTWTEFIKILSSLHGNLTRAAKVLVSHIHPS